MSTPQDVNAITGLDLCPTKISPFITTAKLIIDDIDCDVSAARRDAAITNYAAHLLELSPVGKKLVGKSREKIDNAIDITYTKTQPSGQGVLSTNWGTTANQLMKGCLVDVDKQQATAYAIGCAGSI